MPLFENSESSLDNHSHSAGSMNQPSAFHDEIHNFPSQTDLEADQQRVALLERKGRNLMPAEQEELFAKRLLPGDREGQKLFLKMQHGQANEFECAVLNGRIAFPNNAKGQTLVAMEYLADNGLLQMSDSDRQKLADLREKRNHLNLVTSAPSDQQLKSNEDFSLRSAVDSLNTGESPGQELDQQDEPDEEDSPSENNDAELNSEPKPTPPGPDQKESDQVAMRTQFPEASDQAIQVLLNLKHHEQLNDSDLRQCYWLIAAKDFPPNSTAQQMDWVNKKMAERDRERNEGLPLYSLDKLDPDLDLDAKLSAASVSTAESISTELTSTASASPESASPESASTAPTLAAPASTDLASNASANTTESKIHAVDERTAQIVHSNSCDNVSAEIKLAVAERDAERYAGTPELQYLSIKHDMKTLNIVELKRFADLASEFDFEKGSRGQQLERLYYLNGDKLDDPDLAKELEIRQTTHETEANIALYMKAYNKELRTPEEWKQFYALKAADLYPGDGVKQMEYVRVMLEDNADDLNALQARDSLEGYRKDAVKFFPDDIDRQNDYVRVMTEASDKHLAYLNTRLQQGGDPAELAKQMDEVVLDSNSVDTCSRAGLATTKAAAKTAKTATAVTDGAPSSVATAGTGQTDTTNRAVTSDGTAGDVTSGTASSGVIDGTSEGMSAIVSSPSGGEIAMASNQ